MESRKKITTVEFDEVFRQLFAKHGVSRKSNFLFYLALAEKMQISEADIESIIAGEDDIYFDEEVQQIRMPIPDFLRHKDLLRVTGLGHSCSLVRGLSKSHGEYDITRQHKYIYFDFKQAWESLSNSFDNLILAQKADVLTKFRNASDTLILQDAIDAVDAAFKPFDEACLTHQPPADSDLDKVLQLVSNMRQCFNHLPDKVNCELTVAAFEARCAKFEYLINRLLPYAEETHAFAKSNTEEFAWLVALKKAGEFYRVNCATARILDALLFQQQLGDFLTANAIKASEHETIFGSLMAYGKRFETYSRADYIYRPTDPTHIYLSFHLIDDSHCEALREHLLAMDDKKEMSVIEVCKPADNHGFYEVKVRSTDALNILLPKFKAIFDKKLQEHASEVLQYQGKASPMLNRKCAIAFFDPKAQFSSGQVGEVRKRRAGK